MDCDEGVAVGFCALQADTSSVVQTAKARVRNVVVHVVACVRVFFMFFLGPRNCWVRAACNLTYATDGIFCPCVLIPMDTGSALEQCYRRFGA